MKTERRSWPKAPPVAPPPPADRESIRSMLLENEGLQMAFSRHTKQRPYADAVSQFMILRESTKEQPWKDPDDVRRHFFNWIPKSPVNPRTDANRKTPLPASRNTGLRPNGREPKNGRRFSS